MKTKRSLDPLKLRRSDRLRKIRKLNKCHATESGCTECYYDEYHCINCPKYNNNNFRPIIHFTEPKFNFFPPSCECSVPNCNCDSDYELPEISAFELDNHIKEEKIITDKIPIDDEFCSELLNKDTKESDEEVVEEEVVEEEVVEEEVVVQEEEDEGEEVVVQEEEDEGEEVVVEEEEEEE